MKFAPVAMLAILTAACSTPAEKKAELDAFANPQLCRKALSEGVPAQSLLPDEKYQYQTAFYRTCLRAAADKDPDICAGVLAAGAPPGIKGLAGTKEEMQAIMDYWTCWPYASRLKGREQNTSRLNLPSEPYS